MRDRWGNDPNVALYIGGPKDGRIESIKGAGSQRYPIAESVRPHSFTDPYQPLYTHFRYGTYEPVQISVYGDRYTVMVDQREHTRSYIEARVMDETRKSNIFGIATTQQWQSSWTFTVDDFNKALALILGEQDTRTDEEKLSWVTEKTPGKKEFL